MPAWDSVTPMTKGELQHTPGLGTPQKGIFHLHFHVPDPAANHHQSLPATTSTLQPPTSPCWALFRHLWGSQMPLRSPSTPCSASSPFKTLQNLSLEAPFPSLPQCEESLSLQMALKVNKEFIQSYIQIRLSFFLRGNKNNHIISNPHRQRSLPRWLSCHRRPQAAELSRQAWCTVVLGVTRG